MKLKVTKKEDNKFEMVVGGEGHTLLNLLQSSLLKQKGVEMAGYSKPHPLMDRSILYVNMKKGKPPEDALVAAAEDAREIVNDFLDKFEREVSRTKKNE
jgi:DNA-directed RNA polymerase subunit L